MDERIHTLVARKLLGTASPEEVRELERWIAADPEGAGVVRTLLETRQSGPSAAAGAAPEEVDAAWRRIRRRIGTGPAVPSIPERLRRLRPAVLRVAAILILGFGALFAVDAFLETRIPTVSTVVSREVRTERGERRLVVLPDGSRVVLAPESRLAWPSTFPEGARSVELDGQGYLEVATDPGRPFRVATANARITVLGTRFVVRAYPGEASTRVAVEEGSVDLARRSARGPAPGDTGARGAVVLEAGDLGRLEEGAEAPVRVAGGADDRHLGWLRGRLVFRDAAMSSVLAELSRFYDLDLRAPEAVLVRRVSFSVDDQPEDQVLDLLSRLLDLRVRREGDVIHLEPRSD